MAEWPTGFVNVLQAPAAGRSQPSSSWPPPGWAGWRAEQVAPAFQAALWSEQQLSPVFAQGIARAGSRWVVSGRDAIAVLDDGLRTRRANVAAIPGELSARGYDHVGDIDVVGRCIYAPLEQPHYDLGEQVTARYDLRTLRFVDSVTLPQHENSFVALDPRTGVAYSMDRFGGTALLRYDVLHGWRALTPLAMNAALSNVQGAAVGAGAIWLSTSDPTNSLFRVDARSGHVDLVGSMGHLGGEGEGIAFAPLVSGVIHTTTVDVRLTPVWLGHFAVSDVSRRAAARPASRKRRLGTCRADARRLTPAARL